MAPIACPECGRVFDDGATMAYHRVTDHALAPILAGGRTKPMRNPSSKTSPSSPFTYTFMDLGGPPLPGLEWDVLRYSLTGNDPFTPVAGAAVVVFIAQVPPADSNAEPTFPELVDTSAGVPAAASWSAHQVVLGYGEHLIAGVKSWPASTQIMGNMQYQQYRRGEWRPWQ